MDEVKIESGFAKAIIAKVIAKSIKKKYGCDVDLKLNGFTATIINGRARIHLNAEAEIDRKELASIFDMAEVTE